MAEVRGKAGWGVGVQLGSPRGSAAGRPPAPALGIPVRRFRGGSARRSGVAGSTGAVGACATRPRGGCCTARVPGSQPAGGRQAVAGRGVGHGRRIGPRGARDRPPQRGRWRNARREGGGASPGLGAGKRWLVRFSLCLPLSCLAGAGGSGNAGPGAVPGGLLPGEEERRAAGGERVREGGMGRG